MREALHLKDLSFLHVHYKPARSDRLKVVVMTAQVTNIQFI
ncbi:hypothetical protein OFEAOIEE_LOCUS4455 [Methylorubrum extorquens]